jgi:hypothetical protein
VCVQIQAGVQPFAVLSYTNIGDYMLGVRLCGADVTGGLLEPSGDVALVYHLQSLLGIAASMLFRPQVIAISILTTKIGATFQPL